MDVSYRKEVVGTLLIKIGMVSERRCAGVLPKPLKVALA